MRDTTENKQSRDLPRYEDPREAALADVYRVMAGGAQFHTRTIFIGLAITTSLTFCWGLFSAANKQNVLFLAIPACFFWIMALSSTRSFAQMEASNAGREAAFIERYRASRQLSASTKLVILTIAVAALVLQLLLHLHPLFSLVPACFLIAIAGGSVRLPWQQRASNAAATSSTIQRHPASLESVAYYRRFATFAKWLLFITAVAGVAVEIAIELNPLWVQHAVSSLRH